MDVKEVADNAAEEPTIGPDVAVAIDEMEDAPAIVVHPLAVAIRQLEILQNQVFLAGSTASIQASSRDQGQPATGEDPGPYCRLACDVLSCAVSACELWRESLLRPQVASPANPCPELSLAELIRLLAKLLASLHILDCLKDSKQALRAALASVTAQEGDEQQLLAAVQDFFNMPTACLILLRDMLIEDAALVPRTKQALLRLLPIQLEAADWGHGSTGQEVDRKRSGGSLKSKLGLAALVSQQGGDGASGPANDGIAARSTARIALSLLVYLYCCVDSSEQEQLGNSHAADGAPGITPTGAKAQAAAAQKLLRACVANLRATPVVYGYGDVPVDLLRPLQGLPQLAAGVPWESITGGSVQQLAVGSEDRYSLSSMTAAAAQDFGRVVEDLLALKLQSEADASRGAEEAKATSAGGDSSAPSRPTLHAQAALSRAAGVLAGRIMHLLQDWQAALLQLDAFRVWQRRQRQEEEAAAEADAEGADSNDVPLKLTQTRCAFTAADMPDVVRVVSYIKGLHGIVVENLAWLEPLVRLHCAAHLGQLVSAVLNPVAQGVLGSATSRAGKAATITAGHQTERPRLPPLAQMSLEDHPLSAPSSARGTGAGSIFASTNHASAGTAAQGGMTAEMVETEMGPLALGLGRAWKGKVAKHGRSHSTASSIDVATSELRQGVATITLAPPPPPLPAVPPVPASVQAEATANGPSQRTTEDSADTGNLIASITAEGLGDWTTGRGFDFRNDPYARLRDWFATGSTGTAATAALGALPGVNAALQPVPEGNTPRSERSPAAATVASFGRRAGAATPSEHVGSLAAGNSPSVHRGSVSSAMAWADGSGARLHANTVTDGTEDGVECTVSSVSDCEGLMAELDSDEELCKPGEAQPQVSIVEEESDDEADVDRKAEAAKPLSQEPKSPSPPPPQSQTQLQPSPSANWPPAADLLWPSPPIPSASWLNSHAISPGNTVSAGGAGSAPPTRSPGSCLPRMTAPAALSTNPLYVYPSAAREAVAEQERATVAIWMASEGGAVMPGSLPPAGQGESEGGRAEDQQRPAISHQHQRFYCNDTGSNALTDSVVQQQSCFGEDRPYREVLNAGGNGRQDSSAQLQLQMHTSYTEIHGYGDEGHVSNSQQLQRTSYGTDDAGGAHVHFDLAPLQAPAPANNNTKKTASSPFKRIKRLFGKRFSSNGEKSVGASINSLSLHAGVFDDPAGGLGGAPDPLLEAFYNEEFPASMVAFGGLPPPYLANHRDVPCLETESTAGLAVQAPSYSGYGLSRNPAGLSTDFLPGIMAEATSRDGAVAVLSVGPATGTQPGHPDASQMLVHVQQGGEMEVLADGAKGGGKVRLVSAGGGPLKGTSSAAAFLDFACRARDEHSIQRLRHFANDMQICLATAGIMAEGSHRPGGGQMGDVAALQRSTAARAVRKALVSSSLKRLVTSIKHKAGGRQRTGGDAGTTTDQDVQFLACELFQSSGLDATAIARLRNVAELMVQELEAMIAQRRTRGKSKDGPSLMQLLALTSELRGFLSTSLPAVEPLLAFRANLDAAADLSSLLVLDPSRPYGLVPGNGLGSDARGSVPWELAHKGVLVSSPGSDSSAAAGTGAGMEMPLSAGLTVLTLFKDAIEAIQLQQAQAAATGYPEAPTAGRLQQLYRRQAKWCLNTFVQMAARKVWGTYKAHAVRSRLGLPIPSGAPDVASSSAAFQGLLQSSGDSTSQQLLMLTSSRPELGLESELTITDQLAGAIDDLVRHSAARTAELLLGSDLTAVVAVKQQLDVLTLAVSRLRRDLPTLRPWNDVWLAALAARAASAPTCSGIAEAAASTAAAVTQGCASNTTGLVTVEDIILMHASSMAALRTLSTWSYDMTAVRFRPTKHTKVIWDGLVGSAGSPEAAPPPPLLFPDGADIALATAATGSTPASTSSSGAPVGRFGEGNTAWFGRAHVQALHSLLGLDGVGRWVAAMRRHSVELLAEASPLLRRVHELYDTSLAGPRGPGMRESGGPSGYLQLQQRWLRDRGHSELLVSAHRVLQALGNTVATVALTDSVLAELCVGRAPHLLPLAASSLQADQQAHATLKAVAASEAPANMSTSLVKASGPPAVPPPPRGAGLAGLLLGQQLPPGLMNGTQSAVQAASLVQDRLQEQLPAAFGLPGLWRALHDCLHPAGSRSERLLSAERLWCVVQLQLSCLSPEEQVVHTSNVGDGVYVSGAALVQLAGGAPVAPGSVLNGDTMTLLQQAVALEQLKAELAAVTATPQTQSVSYTLEKATFDQLRAWAGRAEAVRAAWDRAVQLTVGAGTSAARLIQSFGPPRSARPDGGLPRSLDLPALTACTSEPWNALAQQAAAAGTAMLIRAAAAASAAPPQHTQPLAAPIVAQSAGGGQQGARGAGAGSLGRPSSQPGSALHQSMPNPLRHGPPRPPTAGPQQPSAVSANGVTGVQRVSINGPPLPPRMTAPVPSSQAQARSIMGGSLDAPLVQQQQQQQQALQQMRAASQVLMRSPRGEGSTLGTHGLFNIAGSTAAQSRSRPGSSIGDWGHME